MNCCSDLYLPGDVASSTSNLKSVLFCASKSRQKDQLGTSAEVGNFFRDADHSVINMLQAKMGFSLPCQFPETNFCLFFAFLVTPGWAGRQHVEEECGYATQPSSVASGAFLAVANRWHF